jgi:Domain of unknown function (DUF4184)
MPFTLAHPAAIFPLRRLPALDPLPLIVGSIVPDIGYYLPPSIAPLLPNAHSVVASVTFCLPAGFVLLLMLLALAPPLLEPLPARHRRFVAASIQNFAKRKNRLAVAVVSILVGAWTHIVWDSFTHRGGWAVEHSALLRTSLEVPGLRSVEIFRILQYLSSLVGLVIILFWYISAERRFVHASGPAENDGRVFLLGLLLALSVAIAALGARQWAAFSLYQVGFLALTSGIAIFCVLWFVSGCLLVALRRSKKP